MYLYRCMYAVFYVYLYICMYVAVYVCYWCMYIRLYVHVCMYVSIKTNYFYGRTLWVHIERIYLHTQHVCSYVCMYCRSASVCTASMYVAAAAYKTLSYRTVRNFNLQRSWYEHKSAFARILGDSGVNKCVSARNISVYTPCMYVHIILLHESIIIPQTNSIFFFIFQKLPPNKNNTQTHNCCDFISFVSLCEWISLYLNALDQRWCGFIVGFCLEFNFFQVLQKRTDGTLEFYKGWHDYKHGFGNIGGEFWLGLEKMHLLTNFRVSFQLFG